MIWDGYQHVKKMHLNRPAAQVNKLVSPNAAYMLQWIISAFVQIMACRIFGAKPLFKQMLVYCQLDPSEQNSVKFWSKYTFFIR